MKFLSFNGNILFWVQVVIFQAINGKFPLYFYSLNVENEMYFSLWQKAYLLFFFKSICLSTLQKNFRIYRWFYVKCLSLNGNILFWIQAVKFSRINGKVSLYPYSLDIKNGNVPFILIKWCFFFFFSSTCLSHCEKKKKFRIHTVIFYVKFISLNGSILIWVKW